MQFRARFWVARALVWGVAVVVAGGLRSSPKLAAQTSSVISRSSWTAIGPGNIGGRIRALAVHPTSPSTMFAGGANGGIWKSTDAGASWTPVNDYLPSLAITTIVFQPGTPSTMYAGTGESFVRSDGARGAGILKSSDGGATWSQLSSTTTSDFYYVNRLAMSANGSILLAATSTGVFRSTDGGGNFTQVLTATGTGYTEFDDVKFLAGASTNAIAAGNSQNAYRSSDGGATWSPATGLVTQTTNASAPQGMAIGVSGSGSTVYLSINNNGGEVWKSTNGGASYSKVGTPGHLQLFGASANSIWIDPTNSSTLVVGGDDVYRSTNGGTGGLCDPGVESPSCWTKISAKNFAPSLSIHAQQNIIVGDPAFDGSSNKRVYFGNDGGVWKTDDIYASPQEIQVCCRTIPFTSLNNNLGITQFYGAAADPNSGTIVGGSQGNGTLIYTPSGGAQGWTIMSGDDAGYAAIDPTNSKYIYGEFAYLRIYRSVTAGAQPAAIYGPNSGGTCKAAPYRIDDACNGTTNPTAPFMLDPNSADRLIAGGVSLWRSNDAKADLTDTSGPTWSAIKSPTGGNSPISALTVAQDNSDVIWVGHNDGDVYVTTNGTAPFPTWTRVDGSSLPDRLVTALAVDSRNTSVAYVGFDGFNPDSLWKTTDNGTTWSAVSGTPAVAVRSIAIDPRGSDFIFLGTDAGVFTSRDGGATWDSSTVGPANTAVDQLVWMGSTLIAATHGRGMFTTSVPSPVSANPMNLAFSAAHNPGAPVNLTFTPAQSVALNYTGGTTPSWTASADQSWISAAVNGGVVTVSIVNPGDVIGSQVSLSGTITMTAANVETSLTIPVSLSVLTNGPSNPIASIDTPGPNAPVRQKGFNIAGWALDRGSMVGTGIDQVHVYAVPFVGTSLGTPSFLGMASLGSPRPDVASSFGAQFTLSGFSFLVTGLATGNYRLMLFGHSTISNAFFLAKTVDVTVTQIVSSPAMSLDAPSNGSTVRTSFSVFGWAVDRGADDGTTGVGAVHVYAFPLNGGAPIFLGLANYGSPRADIGALFGTQFTNSGFSLQVSGLSPGDYRITVFAFSSVTGTFNQWSSANVTVVTGSNPANIVDAPAPGSVLTRDSAFFVGGWAIDRGALPATGTGVSLVHVWAIPAGADLTQAFFLGQANYGIQRSDVGAAFGAQFTNSGYSMFGKIPSSKPAGQYDIYIFAYTTVANQFVQSAKIRVTVQ